MADRAYLYSDDRPDAWDAPESGCYDPRWTLPIAWLFFFRPEDVRLIDVQYGGSQWQEVRMSSETSTALELIERRKPLPMSIVGHRIVDDVVARCVSKVGGGRGQYLMVDPSGVLGGINRDFEDDRGHAGRIARILAVLGDGSCPAEVARETTWPYVTDYSPDPAKFECQALGYTYRWEALPGEVGDRIESRKPQAPTPGPRIGVNGIESETCPA